MYVHLSYTDNMKALGNIKNYPLVYEGVEMDKTKKFTKHIVEFQID